MKKFLIIIICGVLLIRCTSKDNLVVQSCDTCSQHIDTSKSKKDTTTTTIVTVLDTIPVSISIAGAGDSSFFEKLSSPSPIYLSVLIRNKEGSIIKGVPVAFSAGLHSGSLNHDTTNTDAQGMANAIWTLGPQADTSQQVIAKVVYKNTSLSVSFHALLTHDTLYNYIGTLTMDSTNMPADGIITTDSTNAPDPFTIVSDPLALSNGIPYPFELDGVMIPTLLPGEHGRGEFVRMTINQQSYSARFNYEVGGHIIIEATTTGTFTNRNPALLRCPGNYEARKTPITHISWKPFPRLPGDHLPMAARERLYSLPLKPSFTDSHFWPLPVNGPAVVGLALLNRTSIVQIRTVPRNEIVIVH